MYYHTIINVISKKEQKNALLSVAGDVWPASKRRKRRHKYTRTHTHGSAPHNKQAACTRTSHIIYVWIVNDMVLCNVHTDTSRASNGLYSDFCFRSIFLLLFHGALCGRLWQDKTDAFNIKDSRLRTTSSRIQYIQFEYKFIRIFLGTAKPSAVQSNCSSAVYLRKEGYLVFSLIAPLFCTRCQPSSRGKRCAQCASKYVYSIHLKNCEHLRYDPFVFAHKIYLKEKKKTHEEINALNAGMLAPQMKQQ